jgi:hypothetical protein
MVLESLPTFDIPATSDHKVSANLSIQIKTVSTSSEYGKDTQVEEEASIDYHVEADPIRQSPGTVVINQANDPVEEMLQAYANFMTRGRRH